MVISKLESVKTIVFLLIAMVTMQMATTVVSVTNSVNGAHRQQMIEKIQNDYMPYELVLNFMDSFGAQLQEAGIYARKDSASFARTSEKYNELRIQWMRDIRAFRGTETGGTGSTSVTDQ